MDDGEAVAEEAVPFGGGGGRGGGRRRHRGFGVEDLEVEGEVPRQRLRVTARVEEEAAVEAADLEVAAVEGAGAGAGELREGPPAGGGGVPAAVDGESRRRGFGWRRGRVIGGDRRGGGGGGGGGSGGLHGLGIFGLFSGVRFHPFFSLVLGKQEQGLVGGGEGGWHADFYLFSFHFHPLHKVFLLLTKCCSNSMSIN